MNALKGIKYEHLIIGNKNKQKSWKAGYLVFDGEI